MTAPLITRRRLLGAATAALALPVALSIPQPAMAETPRVYASNGVAINGYDPVAYFTQAMPVRGDATYTATWDGAEWRFSSEENKQLFEANPERYAPQYGGYCAFAVASGYTAKTDPDAWSVVDDKLYLNFNKRIRSRWLRDVPGNIAKGDANWPSVLEG